MKNVYIVTRKQYRAWVLEGKFRGIRLIMTIVWCILSGWIMLSWLRYILWPLGLFCIYRAVFYELVMAGRQYSALAKTYGQENWQRVISFEEEHIFCTDGKMVLQLEYADIVSVKEKKNWILLKLKNKATLRLYYDAFVDTDWPACKAWIEEKRASV